MDFAPLNSEPIDPLVIDAAAAAVLTGERKGVSRWPSQSGGRFSRLDGIFLGFAAAVVLVAASLLLV